jgi:hypothetical protein
MEITAYEVILNGKKYILGAMTISNLLKYLINLPEIRDATPFESSSITINPLKDVDWVEKVG